MAFRSRIDTLIHSSEDPNLKALEPDRSRWGHGGLFCTWEEDEDPPMHQHVYRLHGPFTIYAIEDEENGSFDILTGDTTDQEFLAVITELGDEAKLPGPPPWDLPADHFGIDYFRELHRLLRERFEADGYDGWWMGGELVLWNYDAVSKIEKLDETEVNREPPIDARVRNLVAALDELAGVSTFSSCGGHEKVRWASQVPAAEFYVDFDIDETVEGWRALNRIGVAIDELAAIELSVWFDGGVHFDLHGYE